MISKSIINSSAITPTNVLIEIDLTASLVHIDPFNEIHLDLIFTDPAGTARKVPAFWSNGNIWKVRYASPLIGVHRWRSESNVSDAGLHNVEGVIEVVAYTGDNLLYKKGPIQAKAGQRHMEYADGTPFFWLGDTWWMGLSHRLQWPKEFQQLAQDRKEKGFNVVQLVAGLYPDMHPFDPRGANEAGFPWEENYARIRPDYFDAVDSRLQHLIELGITPCLVGAWGYFLTWMGVDKLKAHWRYLIARYGAYPIVWCAAGEANLPWYLAENFPSDDRTLVTGWTKIMRFILETDAFHRPLTIHPTAINRYTARHVTEDPVLLDFDFLQTPHGQRDAVAITVRAVRDSYNATPIMPVINGEPAYEMLGDKLESDWTRSMFWLCVTNGTKGHTYGANGIWQLNRPDDPHGPSPHTQGTGYGIITWEEAMRLPGSKQIALGKAFIESLPWTELVPMPDSIGWADSLLSNWIWFPSEITNPDKTPDRYFRRTFEVPNDFLSGKAILRVSAADKFTLWLNGKELETTGQNQSQKPLEFTVALQPERNVLAIHTDSSKNPFISNSAGFALSLEIRFSNRTEKILTADSTWRGSAIQNHQWQEVAYDDSAWVAPFVASEDPLLAPQSCGIANQLRLIYALEARRIVIRDLAPLRSYAITHFNPTNGTRSSLATQQADSKGEILFDPPAGRDWALLLKAI